MRINIQEVIEKVFEEVSGGEEVSGDEESVDEGEQRAEDVLLDPNIDAITFLKTKPIYPRNIYIRIKNLVGNNPPTPPRKTSNKATVLWVYYKECSDGSF